MTVIEPQRPPRTVGRRAARAPGRRHHQPQLPRALRRPRVRAAAARATTPGLLGIDRAAERIASERAAALGIASGAARGRRTDCLVTELRRGVADRRRASRRSDPASAAAGAARASTTRGSSCRCASGSPDLLEPSTRRIVARARRRRCRATTRRRRTLVDPDRRRASPLREPVPCHDDLLPGNIMPQRRCGPRDARRLGVRGHGPPLVRPRQPGGQQRVRAETPRSGCSRRTSTSRPADRRRGGPALKLMRALRRARGGVGRRPGRHLRARLRLPRRTPTSTSSDCGRRSRTPTARSGLPPRLSPETARRAGAGCRGAARASRPRSRGDHRRRRRRRLDRLPPGGARRARRRAARPQRADQRLDLPLGRARRPAARRASR